MVELSIVLPNLLRWKHCLAATQSRVSAGHSQRRGDKRTVTVILPLIEAAGTILPASGPAGSLFGDTAFGASSQGMFNSGFYRLGWGRGLGRANFRFGRGNWEVE